MALHQAEQHGFHGFDPLGTAVAGPGSRIPNRILGVQMKHRAAYQQEQAKAVRQVAAKKGNGGEGHGNPD